jgi:glutamine synthetase type III
MAVLVSGNGFWYGFLSISCGGVRTVNSARREAIAAINNYKPIESPWDFRESPPGELFGCNVFNETVMKERLSKDVYKALQNTIKRGAKMDPSIANEVASAMKKWALEKGATHYAHVFQPLTGLTAEKHALGWHSSDLRGPWLHGMGLHQPGVHP